jgi:hypothetical protein
MVLGIHFVFLDLLRKSLGSGIKHSICCTSGLYSPGEQINRYSASSIRSFIYSINRTIMSGTFGPLTTDEPQMCNMDVDGSRLPHMLLDMERGIKEIFTLCPLFFLVTTMLNVNEVLIGIYLKYGRILRHAAIVAE